MAFSVLRPLACALLLLPLFAELATAQSADTLTTYVDRFGNATTAEGATYIRKAWTANTRRQLLEFYPSGKLHRRGQFNDSSLKSPVGQQRIYFENGQPAVISFYHNGELDGIRLQWYENGQLADSEQYVAGVLTGDQVWYHENGQVSEKTIQRNDSMVSIFYTPDGREDPQGQSEVQPQFNGNINQFLAKTLRYPENERENGNMGRVTIEFVVEKDGTVGDAIVARSSGFPALDNEALRVIRSMPPWKPGVSHNRICRAHYTLPVTFRVG